MKIQFLSEKKVMTIRIFSLMVATAFIFATAGKTK